MIVKILLIVYVSCLLVLVAIADTSVCTTSSSSKHPVHAFYYLWYGNPQHDGEYKHWNHEVLPHWEARINQRYPNIGKRFQPPSLLHSPFYPLAGPYSSSDRTTIFQHFHDALHANIEVLVVSWWGRRDQTYATDTQGVNTDMAFEKLLEAAEDFNQQQTSSDANNKQIYIAFHLEPYRTRSIESIYEDIQYLVKTYGHFQCLYRLPSTRTNTAHETGSLVYYVYDSYHIPAYQWGRLLKSEGDLSIRGTSFDAVFIGLWLQSQDGRELHSGGFDGMYSYFASEGFSYGSTCRMWKSMCEYAHKQDMYCSLSVGPGYDDSLIRPWNAFNAKDRQDGKYYQHMWKSAIDASPDFVR